MTVNGLRKMSINETSEKLGSRYVVKNEVNYATVFFKRIALC